MPATRTTLQIIIGYDIAEVAFSEPRVGEKDATFYVQNQKE